MLDDAGLVPTLGWLARRFEVEHGIATTLTTANVPVLPRDVELALYRIVQEGLTNVARHARARSVRIDLRAESGMVICTIHDDGQGFDANQVLNNTAASTLGLRGIRERVGQFDGHLTVESAPQRGTALHASIRVTQRRTRRG